MTTQQHYLYPCLSCKKPMRVSKGQVAYYHRACRTQGRYERRTVRGNPK